MLDALFKPRSVAIIGASNNPFSIGHIVIKNLAKYGFKGPIFPINPKSEVRVKLSYTQMLTSADGLVDYRYPLRTKTDSAKPVETLSVLATIESKTAIKSVFSSTHKLAISRPSDHKATASFEAKNVFPDKNFELYYALSDKEFGLTVLTYRQPGQDGFFLARIAPPASVAQPIQIAFKDSQIEFSRSGHVDLSPSECTADKSPDLLPDCCHANDRPINGDGARETIKATLGEQVASECVSVTQRQGQTIESAQEPLPFVPPMPQACSDVRWIGTAQ